MKTNIDFINDLPVAVTSKTRLFADDCILYRQIYNHDDSTTLQQDLDNLAAWEKMFQCFELVGFVSRSL
jgi:hypothetical protein